MVNGRQYWMEQPTKALRPKPARPVVKKPSLDEGVEVLAVEEFRNPEVTGRGGDRGRGLEIKQKSVGSPGLSRYDAQLTPVKKDNRFVKNLKDAAKVPGAVDNAFQAVVDYQFPDMFTSPTHPDVPVGQALTSLKNLFLPMQLGDVGVDGGLGMIPIVMPGSLRGPVGNALGKLSGGKKRPNIPMKKQPKKSAPVESYDEAPITQEIPQIKKVLEDINYNPYKPPPPPASQRPQIAMQEDILKRNQDWQTYKPKTMTSEVDEMIAAKAQGRSIDTSPSVAKREAMDTVSQIEIDPSTAVSLKHDAVVSPQLISIGGDDYAREIAVVQLDNGFRMPFYRRTGEGTQAQKGIHEEGDWKPFYGLKEDIASPGAGWNPQIKRGWFMKHPNHETLHTGTEFERELFDIGKNLKKLFDRGKLKVDPNYRYNSNIYPAAEEDITDVIGSSGRLLGKEGLEGIYGFKTGGGEKFVNPSVRDPLGNPTASYAWKQLPRK